MVLVTRIKQLLANQLYKIYKNISNYIHPRTIVCYNRSGELNENNKI